MKKIETIWHHLLYEALETKTFRHTQQELAARFDYSLSTVNHALNAPSAIGAVRKASKFFILEDYTKLLYYWASVRNLEKDILYAAYLDQPIAQLEGLVPDGAIYGAYTAAKHYLGEPPADYAKVYFYCDRNRIDEVKQRFPPATGPRQQPNVLVLALSEMTVQAGGYTTLPQTFVDLWNCKDWYAKDFTKALEEKMYAILS